jgi:ABC-type multidrug transport system fused ATPase/permease subunit
MFDSAIRRLWAQLPDPRRKQFYMLLVLIVITSLSEVVTIGTVLPFLGALISPEKVLFNIYMEPTFRGLGVETPEQLLLPLTIIFILVTIVSAGLRFTLVWAQTRLAHAIGSDLSTRTYERTLYQPYSVHVSQNSSEVIAGISNKVNTVVYSTLLPLLSAASSVVIAVAIMAMLVSVNPNVALTTMGVFGALYAVIIMLTRGRLAKNSERISRELNQTVKALQEGLSGIRDVLIDGTQSVYSGIYRSAELPLREAQANNQIIGAAPRFLIEALGITLIATLAYALSGADGGVGAAIPLLGALAIGAQRLLPVLQQIYVSWSSLRGGQASLRDILDMIERPLPAYTQEAIIKPIEFSEKITLKNISFSHAGRTPCVLKDINLEISKGARLGFVGTTGSGKSTLLDVLMALLPPAKGNLLIDGIPITDQNLRSWQLHIAHVPQHIFLADTTIAENIAFGVPRAKIDNERVRAAARQACIAETIESLEQGYRTVVGERGVRLSGGQRQRIGIARALYKQSDVIILDEATSALDSNTESAVMAEIERLGREVTILIVAHRLTTLRFCDLIVELADGTLRSIDQ